MSRYFASALPLIFVALGAASHEQTPAKDRQALAEPWLEPNSPEAASHAAEISRTLFDDISFASAFKIVDPERYPLAGASRTMDDHGLGIDRRRCRHHLATAAVLTPNR